MHDDRQHCGYIINSQGDNCMIMCSNTGKLPIEVDADDSDSDDNILLPLPIPSNMLSTTEVD